MELSRYIEINKKLKKHRTYLVGVLSIMMMSNFALSLALLSQNSRTILVPNVLSKGVEISDREVSEEYLELVTRDFIAQVMNMSQENYAYVEEYVLRLAHPASYHALKGELMELEQELKGRGVALNFSIKQISVNKKTLSAEVLGVLETRISGVAANREEKRYRVLFDYAARHLQLKEFYEVKDEKSN